MSGIINLTENNENNENNEYNSNINLPRNKRKTRKLKLKKELKDFKESLKHLPSNPSWYEIKEVDIREFIFCIQRLFKLVDDDIKESHLYDDIFKKHIFMAQTDSSETEWKHFNKLQRTDQALSARLGDFHEEVAGKIPGYRTLPVGHWSGIDVMSEDRTVFMEWKNSASISTDILETVYNKFKKILNKKEVRFVVLACVNVPLRWKRPELILRKKNGEVKIDLTKYKDKIKIMSGKEVYEAMSNSPTFFDRLLNTVKYVFKNKSSLEFMKDIELSMNIE